MHITFSKFNIFNILLFNFTGRPVRPRQGEPRRRPLLPLRLRAAPPARPLHAQEGGEGRLPDRRQAVDKLRQEQRSDTKPRHELSDHDALELFDRL